MIEIDALCPDCLSPLDDDERCTVCDAQKMAERDEDDPYPDRVMVDASGKPHYEP